MDRLGQSFVAQVRTAIAGGSGRGQSLLLGRTPAVLRMLAVPDLPLRMPPGVLHKVLTGKGGERAGLAPYQIEKLPELLDEPVAVLASATVDSALVVLTTGRTNSGVLIASINPTCQDGNSTVNLITSVYAKERQRWIAEQIAADRLMYVDKKKGFDTLEVSGHTLNRVTEPGSQSPSGRKILFPDDLCKFREAARDRAFSQANGSATVDGLGRQTKADSRDRHSNA